MSKYQRWDKENTHHDLSQTYLKNKTNSNCSNNALRKKIDQNLAALINHQKNQKYTLGDTSNIELDDNNSYIERYERYDRSPIKKQKQFISRQQQFREKYAKEDSYQNQYQIGGGGGKNNYKVIPQPQSYNKYSNQSQIYNRQAFTKNSFMNQNFCQQKQRMDETCSRADNSMIQKRQNARKKGFDIRVNNIECINDRISNLLDMVKKDKRGNQKEVQPDKYTPPKMEISNEKMKSYGYSSPHYIGQKKKENQNSHYVQSNYHYSMNRELKVNRQNQEKTPQKKKSYSIMDNQKRQNKSNHKSSFINGQENNENDRNKSKIDYEEQYNKVYKGNDTQYSKKYDRYSLYAKEDRIIEDKSKYTNFDKDTVKNYKYSDNYQNSVLKSKQVDRMLEQKRKQREKVKENILKESQRKVQQTKQEQQRQKIKEKEKQKQKQKQRESEKEKERERQRQRQKQRQKQRQRQRQNEKQKLYRKKDSPKLQNQLKQQYESKKAKIPSPIRQFQSEQFSQTINNRVNLLPITLSSKQQRKAQNQKVNTSSKIFDQQINRIKSKLQQSDQTRQYSALKHQNREDNEKTGKLYNKGSNKFELKIYPVQNTKQCTVKIAQKLSELVSIDGRCRTYRQSFQKYDNNQKWKELQKELQKQGINIGLKDLEDIVRISPDEHNPFGNQKSAHLLNCTRDLASIFAQATKYWQQEIEKCVDLSTLKKQQFDVKDMDLNKKGYLSIEDFVCFINLYTGHFYRNRDICLVYKRFLRLDENRKMGVPYNKFLQKVAK